MSLDRFVKMLLAVCALALAVPVAANAATFTVNTTSDDVSAPSASMTSCPATCTLRDAVIAADNSSGSSTINLPAGHYRLTLSPTGTDDGTTGDLHVTGGTVQINGASARTTSIDATGLGDRVLNVSGTANLSLAHLTVTGGSVADNKGGGGIFDDATTGTLTLSYVAVVGNVASQSGEGGGVYDSESGSTVNIDHSLIANNHNSGDGGGITTNGTVSITDSTISNNLVDTALYPANTNWGAYGGAMEVDGGTVNLSNVTIAGNAIHGTNNGPTPSTSGGSGTAIDAGSNKVTGTNVIVYGNTASGTAVAGNCDSSLPQTSNGHNVDQDGSCFTGGTGDTTADPKLGALANNGGETDTMAIGSSGSAYNTGSNTCVSPDQRGVNRPVGSACDIGAFELAPPVNTAAPTISGMAVNLQTLSCSQGTWAGSPFQSYSYQWKRDGTGISGATSTTYSVTVADVGHQLTCTVTSSTPADGSASATSAAVTAGYPSNKFSFGKLALNKHKGTATQTVKVPGAGKLVLKGKGVKTARKTASGGKVKLKIVLSAKQLRLLKAAGKLKVKVAVTFTPTGGKPLTKHKKITLIFKP
jgi:hypothetical protein